MGKRAAVIEVPDYFTPRDALNKLFDYYGSYSEPGGRKLRFLIIVTPRGTLNGVFKYYGSYSGSGRAR